MALSPPTKRKRPKAKPSPSPTARTAITTSLAGVWTTDDGTAVSVSGNSFVMPAANVTVTAQFHYDPPYIPSYYDIYFDRQRERQRALRLLEHKHSGGWHVRFLCRTVTGYDPETLIVEYKRGRAGSWKTVEPNSRGQYRITNVHADIYVRSRVEPIEDPDRPRQGRRRQELHPLRRQTHPHLHNRAADNAHHQRWWPPHPHRPTPGGVTPR